MLQLTINGGWTQFVEPLRNRIDFNTHGNLRGRNGAPVTLGRLHPIYHDSARKADFVVYSYETPIAWHRPDLQQQGSDTEWVFPDVRYSVTTTKAQGRIATALAMLEGWVRA